MRARHPAGRPDKSDHLATRDRVADGHEHTTEMMIDGHQSQAMLDVDGGAAVEEVAGEGDHAAIGTHRTSRAMTPSCCVSTSSARLSLALSGTAAKVRPFTK